MYVYSHGAGHSFEGDRVRTSGKDTAFAEPARTLDFRTWARRRHPMPAGNVAHSIAPEARPSGPQQNHVAILDLDLLRLRGRFQMFRRNGEIRRQFFGI